MNDSDHTASIRSLDITTLSVAWIGLGTMGGPMSARLVASGVQVIGFDLSEDARAKAQSRGLEIAETVAEAVADADVVVTNLPAGEQVREVFEGQEGIWANCGENALLIDTSTVDVATSRWCHEGSTEHDLRFVDAPISGGAPGAEDGTLTVMFGGESDAVSVAQQVFEPMMDSAISAGGPTTGVAAKICNNMMLFINLVSTTEGSQLAEQLGLDPKVFQQIAAASSGRSFPLEVWYPHPGVVDSSPANRNFAADFPATGALKDVSLALDAGEKTGVKLSAANLAASQFQELIDQGLGDKDCSLIVKLASPDGKVKGFDN